MDKLIIHAGFHKTGTSAIQETLSNNRDYLWANGYSYPDPHPFDAHHRFASKLKNASSLEEGVKEAEKMLLSYKQHAGGRTVLLSSEILSEQVDPFCFRTIPNIFDEIQIVFYVRQQDDLRESAYNQQVKKSREYRTIDEYQPYRWNLYEDLKRFSDAINGSDVYALEYNRKVFVDEDINTDFFERVLGLPYNVPNLMLNKTANQSLSCVTCAIMARLNKLSITDQQRIKIMEILTSVFPIKDCKQYSLLSDDFRIELVEKSEDSNRSLRRDYLRSGEFKYNNMGKIFLDGSRLNEIIQENLIIHKLSNILDDAQYDLDNILMFKG